MRVTLTSIIFICTTSLRLTPGRSFRELHYRQLAAWQPCCRRWQRAGAVSPPDSSPCSLSVSCHQAVPKHIWEASGFLKGTERGGAWSMRSLWLSQQVRRGLWPHGAHQDRKASCLCRSDAGNFVPALQVQRGQSDLPKDVQEARGRVFRRRWIPGPQPTVLVYRRYKPRSWTSVLRNQSRNSVPVPEPPSETVCLVLEGDGPCCPSPQCLPGG